MTPTLMRVPRGRLACGVAMPQWSPLAGRLLGFGKGASDHDRIRPARERLANVTSLAHAAIGDDRNVARRSS